MLRLTTRTTEDALVVKLEGCVAGPWVRELEALWLNAVPSLHGRPLRVDLTDVCHVDRAGRELIGRMLRSGVRFVARGCVLPEMLRELEKGR